MPFVARSIPILSGPLSVSLTPRILLLAAMLVGFRPAAAQDTTAPAGEDATTEQGQPSSSTSEASSAPQSDPAPQEDPGPGANQGQAQGAPADCLQEILEQQKKTRALRELTNPLPRIIKQDADKVRRRYAMILEEEDTYVAADLKIVQDMLAYNLFRATDPEFVLNPANMQGLLQDMENDIARCGKQIGNAAKKSSARKRYFTEVLAVTRQLLQNNLDSRIAAVNILRMLYDVHPPAPAKATLFAGALPELLTVLADNEQPDSVKVAAANSVRNVLRNCDVTPADQELICDAIDAAMTRPCSEPAYQIGLLDVLFGITSPRRVVGAPEPTALKVFAKILDDEKRPIEVRCHAALGAGRGAYDARVNFDPFAYRIAELTLETGVLFSLAKDGDQKWVGCGFDLFFAFRPLEKAEGDKGLMNRAPRSALVAGAAPLVIKTAPIIIENGRTGIPLEDLNALKAWIHDPANHPASGTWDSEAPPLKVPQRK
jgi:hypothetical protein